MIIELEMSTKIFLLVTIRLRVVEQGTPAK
jgi:hypothetical protein